MMIHKLPAPVRGNEYVHITARRDAPPDSGMVLHYRLGNVGEEGFVPDALIPEIRRSLDVHIAGRIRDRAASARAPTTAGAQEFRYTDVLAIMDEEGLWDPTA